MIMRTNTLSNGDVKYTLCHFDQNCCPEVVVGDENVLIKDDFGGTVKMTREQFCILATGIKSGKIVS